MKYLIYYLETEPSREGLDDILEDVDEEAVKQYMETRWLSFIPMIPTSGRGTTQEEARSNAVQNALDSLAFYLKQGQLKVEDLMRLEFEDATETKTIEQLAKMGPQFHEKEIAAE
jgi:hypothetical protein